MTVYYLEGILDVLFTGKYTWQNIERVKFQIYHFLTDILYTIYVLGKNKENPNMDRISRETVPLQTSDIGKKTV